ncbi:hypothetical protein MAPG_11242 [Magnaporthiopsis poae ATCC 64411]|uniref:Uncharacterized protein n=1 Tax=Magnaporthiopsis poae (strain ATCC 64411 / 73-15) TaxID=644358 RepID=A0A0C4EER4_MAGP6|nr:hypothetical protein MAPG_11242 [Magnaporthiopsis poae ATCC 64411]
MDAPNAILQQLERLHKKQVEEATARFETSVAVLRAAKEAMAPLQSPAQQRAGGALWQKLRRTLVDSVLGKDWEGGPPPPLTPRAAAPLEPKGGAKRAKPATKKPAEAGRARPKTPPPSRPQSEAPAEPVAPACKGVRRTEAVDTRAAPDKMELDLPSHSLEPSRLPTPPPPPTAGGTEGHCTPAVKALPTPSGAPHAAPSPEGAAAAEDLRELEFCLGQVARLEGFHPSAKTKGYKQEMLAVRRRAASLLKKQITPELRTRALAGLSANTRAIKELEVALGPASLPGSKAAKEMEEALGLWPGGA